MSLKGIILDVDGTLLTSEHRVTGATRAAVWQARAAGLYVMLASARGLVGLRPILTELELSGVTVCFNGALVCEVGVGARATAILADVRLSLASASTLIDRATALGLEIGWHSTQGWWAPQIGSGLRREAGITGERLRLMTVRDAACEAPHKLLCIAHDATLKRALHELASDLPADCQGQFSHRNYLEITAEGVDKAGAVRGALHYLGLRAQDVAAIGDGDNDAALLALAGTGVAMGNATPSARRAADFLTETNDREGVAIAVESLLGGCGVS